MKKPYRPPVRKEDEHRINEKIRGVAEVRLVGRKYRSWGISIRKSC